MELLPSQATTRKALVHREREAAQTLLGPRASTALGEKPASTAFLNKRIGVELGFPRRLSLSQMQLREASFVSFLRWALGADLSILLWVDY